MAGLSRKGRSGKAKPEMNVTPLVDVVLVLLIIFMIVIPASQGVPLEVPAIANPDEETTEDGPEPIVLSINARGSYFIDDALVPDGQVAEGLTAAHRRNPNARLVLRGDRGLAYVRAREAFEAAQRVGFPGISLRVNHAEPDPRAGGAE